jgi:hypothetical protein
MLGSWPKTRFVVGRLDGNGAVGNSSCLVALCTAIQDEYHWGNCGLFRKVQSLLVVPFEEVW